MSSQGMTISLSDRQPQAIDETAAKGPAELPNVLSCLCEDGGPENNHHAQHENTHVLHVVPLSEGINRGFGGYRLAIWGSTWNAFQSRATISPSSITPSAKLPAFVHPTTR